MLVSRRAADPAGHDYVSRAHAAARLAELLGYDYAGDPREEAHVANRAAGQPCYFVPDDTLLAGEADRLGVRSRVDLFGGVVPHAFVATKAISHGTIAPGARVPAGWSHAVAPSIEDVVLYGFTAFDRADARAAARRVLRRGRARLKRVDGSGGTGQTVVADADEFDEALAAVGDDELALHGVVVEQNLEEVTTCSIGQIDLGERCIAYYGTQRSVLDRHGRRVYGGSDLVVVRGKADALRHVDMPETARTALDKADRYDAVMAREFPGLLVSRRNYDVACGRDADGRLHVGVLEQSWRFGGASAAEIGALRAFGRDAGLRQVLASTYEVHGEAEPPPEAVVSFHGVDAKAGPMTKYSTVEAHGHPA